MVSAKYMTGKQNPEKAKPVAYAILSVVRSTFINFENGM